MIDHLVAKYNFWICIFLMMMGLFTMINKKNLIKKIIGMNIFQTAAILFFISLGVKKGATVPIAIHSYGEVMGTLQASQYINPLPHVLMLTAIVVMISTTGVALAIALKIYNVYGTLEEEELPTEEGK